MRPAALVVALTLGLWLLPVSEAAACSCAGPGTVCSDLPRADAVFVGRAIGTFGRGDEFEVERAISGTTVGRITIANSLSNCALSFTAGERYVVYAYREGSLLSTNMCTRTRPLSDPRTRADIAYFDRLKRPNTAGALLTGLVRDVTLDLASPSGFGRPLAGVVVTATPVNGGPARTASTRNDGSYEIAGVGPGALRVAATLPEYFERHQPIAVTIAEGSGCAEADVYTRVDGRIRGRLLDEAGQPARGLELHLVDAATARAPVWPSRVLTAVTDEEGFFEFRYVGAGRYVVGVGLQFPLRPGKLDRRRYYGDTLDPAAATVVALGRAERRALQPFRLVPLPTERIITIVVQASSPEIARRTTVSLTGATRQLVEHDGTSVTLRLPFGAEYRLEARPPDGFRIVQPGVGRIERDDIDRTITIQVVPQ